MNKFILTEDEKKRILGLYEQSQPTQFSQFTIDMSSLYGIPEEEMSFLEQYNDNLDQDTKKKYADLFTSQMRNIIDTTTRYGREGRFDNFLKSLSSYSGKMNKYQKGFLDSQIILFNHLKSTFNNLKDVPQDQWEKMSQKIGGSFVKSNQENPIPTPEPTNTTSNEKINTTNDRSYDYKFSNGKYYYSTKGANKWIEAKGEGLKSIKNKIKF
jgi:hypothetical protein